MSSSMSFDDKRPDGAPRYPANGGGGGAAGGGAGLGDSKGWVLLAGLAAFMGLLFAAVSTSDFISHLDRQVHSIHCSFIPGAGAEIGESGCRTVMLSPYSSDRKSVV